MSEVEKKKKGGGALVAALSILLAKGGIIAAKALPTLGDDALKAGAHLAPMADDALRGGASVMTHEAGNFANLADDAAKAATSLEHSSGLVDDGGKFIKPTRMSDSERIARAAGDYARYKVKHYGRDREDEDKKSR